MEQFIGTTDEDVQEAALPILEEIITGIENDDYALYSRHFDSQMLAALPESKFEEVRTKIRNQMGSFVSKRYLGFLNKDIGTQVLWKGRFSVTSDDILIQLVCAKTAGAISVKGLWFA